MKKKVYRRIKMSNKVKRVTEVKKEIKLTERKLSHCGYDKENLLYLEQLKRELRFLTNDKNLI